MKYIFVTIFIAISIGSYSQSLRESFMKNQCEHFTNGKGATYGIKMKYNIPCEWDSVTDSRTYLVNGFSYDIADSGRIAASIMITKPNPYHKKGDEKKIFSKAWAKDVVAKMLGAELINVKEVDIDGHQWAEYTLMHTANTPQGVIYQILTAYYIIVDKGITIMVAYKTMSKDQAIGALLYINYLELFQVLASGIHVYNFWE